MYGGSTAASVQKPKALRNPRTLALARNQPCQLLVPGVCIQDSATTVACHSNLAEHNKAAGRKADDCYVVFGCVACHSWLDQGRATYDEKRAVFMGALDRQTEVWREISGDPTRSALDRAAAAWALEHLTATG